MAKSKLKFYVLKYDNEFIIMRPAGSIKTIHIDPKNLPKKDSAGWRDCSTRLREIFGDETYARKSFGENFDIQLVFNMEYKLEGSLWSKTENQVAEESREKDVYDFFNRVNVSTVSLTIPCTEQDIRFFHELMLSLKK